MNPVSTRPHTGIRCLRLAALTGATAFMLPGCQSAQSTTPTAPTAATGEVQMYPGFGNYQRKITTNSAEAQEWFNQGIQLLYGFNHDEAIRTFHRVAELDPDCAMAWWGIAYAHGLHINNPEMTEVQSTNAWEATKQAVQRINNANDAEKALIRAVAARYTWPIPADRSDLDQAYADAMERAWRAHPNDPDVGAWFAESLMNLQPWDLWTADYQPKGRTLEVVATLERVMEIDPYHPGANHFYIHAVEASDTPERAVAAADRLSDLVPGSGHLVHMPSHIYTRVGRYADASDANERAIAADKRYFAMAPAPDFYSLYYIHNVHFLAYAAMMEGRYETALAAARQLENEIPENFLREWPQFADGFMPVTYHVMIRFGKWEDILAEPEPPAFRHISRALYCYARGVALSALGRTDQARAEIANFEREAALIPDTWMIGNNTGSDVMQVARRMLNGELAYREGRHNEAFAQLREGVVLEESLAYDEPPAWMQPVRHALGALLMGVGRYAEAEQVYRDDLAANVHNGWAMLGLEQALRAQQKDAEAQQYAVARAESWTRADVQPTSSCYCEPGETALLSNVIE